MVSRVQHRIRRRLVAAGDLERVSRRGAVKWHVSEEKRVLRADRTVMASVQRHGSSRGTVVEEVRTSLSPIPEVKGRLQAPVTALN